MNIYKEIFDAATHIKENNIKGKCNQGICNMIYNIIGGDYMNVVTPMLECSVDWEEFSGDIAFPVPSPVEGMNEVQIYFSDEHHNYEGEYGEARMRYLDHVIQWSGTKAKT